MKLLKRLTFLLLMAMCVISLNTACSDDDKEDDGGNGGGSTTNYVNPTNVFKNGILKSIDGMAITTNSDGLVTQMKEVEGSDGVVTITFDYAPKTKAALKNQAVKMSVKYESYPEENVEYLFVVGSNGFASSCVETYADGDSESWAFNYNSDGNLIGMVRSEGENEVTKITYKDGNITKVSMTSDEEGEGLEAETSYTSDKVTNPIENKGAIMKFDEAFGIDMDEMELAYYAGMLGKATKHLPVRKEETTDKGSSTTDLEWTLNKNNFPEKLIVKEAHYSDEYLFVW